MNKDKKIVQEPLVVKVELDTKIFDEKLNEANNAMKKFSKGIVECRDCEKFNIAIQIMKSLEWAPNDEGLSLLSFDEESKTIMIDEKSLMRIIQLANPVQQERKIKITSKKI